MASDSNFVQAAIPHFDGHYDHWSMLMENFLQSKEHWPIVESRIQAPAPNTVLSNAQKTKETCWNGKALNFIDKEKGL